MIDEEQIIEVMNFDGIEIRQNCPEKGTERLFRNGKLLATRWMGIQYNPFKELPDYLASLDAIVPVCQKQSEAIRNRIISRTTIFTTPRELCQILLEETGKWKE